MRPVIDLALAVLCCNCERIWELTPSPDYVHGCPCCGSEHFLPVERREQ